MLTYLRVNGSYKNIFTGLVPSCKVLSRSIFSFCFYNGKHSKLYKQADNHVGNITYLLIRTDKSY